MKPKGERFLLIIGIVSGIVIVGYIVAAVAHLL